MRIRTLVVLGVAGAAVGYFFDPQHGRARRARARSAIESLMGRRAGPVDLEPLPENVAPSPSESIAPPEPRAPVEMRPREEPSDIARPAPVEPIAAEEPVEPIAAEESGQPIEMPASSVEHVSIPEADETVATSRGEEPAAPMRPDEPITIPDRDEPLRVVKEWTPRRPIETSEPERPTTTPRPEAPSATTEPAATTDTAVTTTETEQPIAIPGSGTTDRVSKESPLPSDDQEIRSRVRTSLTERRDLGAEDVIVDVSNGVVYLAGGLRDPQTFGEVLDVTRNVPGVRRVQSLLHVPGSETIMKTIAGGPRPDRENGGGSPLQ